MTDSGTRPKNGVNGPATRGSGEIVWVSILNSLENPLARGKWRPGVLIDRRDGHWMTMGLTTRSCYRDGTARRPIPFPLRVGLPGPGFLWGNRLTRVSGLDIGDHIGWVDPPLADLIIEAARLSGAVAEAVRAAAELHYPDDSFRPAA